MSQAVSIGIPERFTVVSAQEAKRLTDDNRFKDNGVDYWKNVGANPVGTIDIQPLYEEIVELASGGSLNFDLRTDFYSNRNEHRNPRILANRVGRVSLSRSPEDVPESVAKVHTHITELVSGIPLSSINTYIGLYPMIENHRNMVPHIDTPRRETTNPKIGKISVITAIPDPTEFLIDGYLFEGTESQVFDQGCIRDENALVGMFIHFTPGVLAIFGATTTVHAEMKHSPLKVLKRTPRLLIRSLIEFSTQ